MSVAALFAAAEWGVTFQDVAPQAGLTGKNVYGGQLQKDYILETTGNGVATTSTSGSPARNPTAAPSARA
jgi:hypothetical protein